MQEEKKKLCPYCDGSVPISASYCPYCGTEMSYQATSMQEPTKTSFYDPPYKTSPVESQPFSFNSQPKPAEPPKAKPSVAKKKAEGESSKSILLTILLLSVGAYLFTLGLLVFFFSENGRLILEWKSRYCLLYCLVAAPFLYIGWLRLNHQ